MVILDPVTLTIIIYHHKPVSHGLSRVEVQANNLHLLCQLRGTRLHPQGLPRPPTHPLIPQDCFAHPLTPILEAVNVDLQGMWAQLPKLPSPTGIDQRTTISIIN